MVTTKYIFQQEPAEQYIIQSGVVYVNYPDRLAILLCPCGCAQEIWLSLMENESPCWKIEGNTVTPSINRLVGCKSHFKITNGNVEL